MTNQWTDIKNAKLIMVFSNPAENHPSVMQYVNEAKFNNGAKVIVVEPRGTRMASQADFFLRIRPGTNNAFTNGVIKYILDNNKYDSTYLTTYTDAKKKIDTATDGSVDYVRVAGTGKPDDAAILDAGNSVFTYLKTRVSGYTSAVVKDICGCSVEAFESVAKQIADSKATDGNPMTILYAMGTTQFSTGGQQTRNYCVLQLLLGNMGKKGGGVNALRGIHNVQGSTDMGVLFDGMPGYSGPPGAKTNLVCDYRVLAPAAATQLDEPTGTTVGQTVINVNDASDFVAEDVIILDSGGANKEYAIVKSVTVTDEVTLRAGLTKAHLDNESVERTNKAIVVKSRSGFHTFHPLHSCRVGLPDATEMEIQSIEGSLLNERPYIFVLDSALAGDNPKGTQVYRKALYSGYMDRLFGACKDSTFPGYGKVGVNGDHWRGWQQVGFRAMMHHFFNQTGNTNHTATGSFLGEDEAAHAQDNFDYNLMPIGNGYDHITMFQKMKSTTPSDNRVKAMVIMGENPVVTEANSTEIKDGLSDLDLLVVADIFLTETADADRNTSGGDGTVKTILLPSASWVERPGTVVNSARVLQWRNQAIQPKGACKSDLEILMRMAKALDPAAFTHINDTTVPYISGVNWSTAHGGASVYTVLYNTTMDADNSCSGYGYSGTGAFSADAVYSNVYKQMCGWLGQSRTSANTTIKGGTVWINGAAYRAEAEAGNAVDLATAISLVNQIKADYEAHRILITGGVHTNADNLNVVTVADAATTFNSARDLADDIKTQYEAHRVLVGVPVRHLGPDNVNAVAATSPATDLNGLITLVNELRDDYNAHRILTAGPVHGAADTTNVVAALADAKYGTKLAGAASTGDTSVTVTAVPRDLDDTTINPGDKKVEIGGFANGELMTIDDPSWDGASTTIPLTAPLARSHADGEAFTPRGYYSYHVAEGAMAGIIAKSRAWYDPFDEGLFSRWGFSWLVNRRNFYNNNPCNIQDAASPNHPTRESVRDTSGNITDANSTTGDGTRWSPGYITWCKDTCIWNDGNAHNDKDGLSRKCYCRGDCRDFFVAPDGAARLMVHLTADLLSTPQTDDVDRILAAGVDDVTSTSVFRYRAYGRLSEADGRTPKHWEPWETPRADLAATYAPVGYEPIGDWANTAVERAKYPLVLTTYRHTEHFGGGPMSRNIPWLIELVPEAVIEINPVDAAARGIMKGDKVEIKSMRNGGSWVGPWIAVVGEGPAATQRVAPGVVAAPWHWANKGLATATGPTANELCIDALDGNTTMPESKACLCQIQKITP